MLPWKLRKRQIGPVSQNLSSLYFSLAKFQLVSCNLSLAIIWQMTYTQKLPKLCSATLISNSRETAKVFRGMRDKINVMVGNQASPLTPGEPLTSQTRATIWSVCELWLPTCLPRQQRKKQLWIVLRFFYEEGSYQMVMFD